MGETLTTWSPSCNGSVRVELSGHRTTSDSGALLLREALDNSGVIEALEDNLVDFRNPLRIRHSLASQLRTLVLQRAMGWIDLSDTDTLRRDPLWQLACNDARGMTPLAQDRPSQATDLAQQQWTPREGSTLNEVTHGQASYPDEEDPCPLLRRLPRGSSCPR